MSDAQLQLFPGRRPPRRAARQTERAIAALRQRHGLDATHVGQVALLRTLGELVDREVADPDGSAFTVARLVTEWRALWSDLVGRRESGLDDELRAFFTGADTGAAAVRDTPEP